MGKYWNTIYKNRFLLTLSLYSLLRITLAYLCFHDQDQICTSNICTNKHCNDDEICEEDFNGIARIGMCKGGRCISQCSIKEENPRPCPNGKSCQNYLCVDCKSDSYCNYGKVVQNFKLFLIICFI